MNIARPIAFFSLFGALACSGLAQTGYQVKPNHPRLLITDVPEVARRCEGPLADDYRVVKDRVDAAVRRGSLEYISNQWSIPEDLMNCALAYLIEREHGREHQKYANAIIKEWGDGSLIANPEGSHFGYHKQALIPQRSSGATKATRMMAACFGTCMKATVSRANAGASSPSSTTRTTPMPPLISRAAIATQKRAR